MVPAVTSSSPATIRSAVVLPQPEGPTSTSSSPSSTCRSSDWTAVVPSGYCLVTDSSAIRDISPSLSRVPGRWLTADPGPSPQQVAGQRLGRELGRAHALPRGRQIELIEILATETRAAGLRNRHAEDAEQLTRRRVPPDAAAAPHAD